MDDRHFDALTKRLATGVSRREVLRILFGSAIGAALTQSTGIPTSADKSSVTTCDGSVSGRCAGLIEYPVKDFSQCPPANLFQFKSATTNNTCDVPFTQDNGTTRNLANHSGKADFTSACIKHDCCFQTCGADFDECNSQFYNDLVATCNAAYPKGNAKCLALAQTYASAVSALRTFYNQDQATVCGCCQACGDGQTMCGEECVDTGTDPNNCLGCGNSCDDGNPCTLKTCNPTLGCGTQPLSDVACTVNGVDGTCVAGQCVTGDANGYCADKPSYSCGGAYSCDDTQQCYCFTTTEGITSCLGDQICNSSALTCQSSADCPSGWSCSTFTCCEGGTCFPPCGTNSVSVAAASVVQSGPTASGSVPVAPTQAPNPEATPQ